MLCKIEGRPGGHLLFNFVFFAQIPKNCFSFWVDLAHLQAAIPRVGEGEGGRGRKPSLSTYVIPVLTMGELPNTFLRHG